MHKLIEGERIENLTLLNALNSLMERCSDRNKSYPNHIQVVAEQNMKCSCRTCSEDGHGHQLLPNYQMLFFIKIKTYDQISISSSILKNVKIVQNHAGLTLKMLNQNQLLADIALMGMCYGSICYAQ